MINNSEIFSNQISGGLPSKVSEPKQLGSDTKGSWVWKKMSGIGSQSIYSEKQMEIYRQATIDSRERKAVQINIERSLAGKSQLYPGSSIANTLTVEDVLNLKAKMFSTS